MMLPRSSIAIAALLAASTLVAQTQADPALVHARRILRASPLIDGHNDLAWVIREDKRAPRDVEAYDLRQRTSGDTDLPRLRSGQVGAQFWSVFIPGEIRDSGYAKVQLEQIDIARRVVERYPEALSLATTASDVTAAFRNGRIGALLGMEGGHAIENSLGALRSYYRLGVRYMTLTHNVTLDWADAAMDVPRHNGLTPFGKEVVREMNRLGMIVDISHVTPKVMHDVLDVTEAPVMFSHSSAMALTDHPRNVPDDVLRRLGKNGGVVMVTFIPAFVSQPVANWELRLSELTRGKPPRRGRADRRRVWQIESETRRNAEGCGRPYRPCAENGRGRWRWDRERFLGRPRDAEGTRGRVAVSAPVSGADPARLVRCRSDQTRRWKYSARDAGH